MNNDIRSQTDKLRQQHDVIISETGDWVLLRHDDVGAAALDDQRFSSQVSRFLQVPNGLDGAEHQRFRALIERYLSPEALTPYLPVFERIAADLVASLSKGSIIDAVSEIGSVFAVRAQCAWLSWPTELEPKLLQWMRDNHQAARNKDSAKMAQVAKDFDDIIHSIIRPDRAPATFTTATSATATKTDSVTGRLCHERIEGRDLTEAELVSILRNWTGGDLGPIALCVGVITVHLLQHPEQVRVLASAEDSKLEAMIDEILRIDDPFVSNRRITTCPVRIGEHQLPSETRVQLNWTSANRDESVFDSNTFAPQKHRSDSLVYGIGKYVCPGRLLATWQLRTITRALLNNISNIALAPDAILTREQLPLGGYYRVPVILS
ncbi:cytochrome P450 [Psychrobacter pygoscelis]|uniref:cytochrome P450 n=1 Tax=Psychrobacter pygoscelis TaxID=2488563 RepID=UPI001F61CBC4|nr:cytochrome P450 [Psychrobacter pygoscelis]